MRLLLATVVLALALLAPAFAPSATPTAQLAPGPAPLGSHAPTAPASAAPANPTLPASDASHGRAVLTGPLAKFPHPLLPTPAAVHPSYYGHFYAGTYYTGANFTSRQLSTTLNVPQDVAGPNDFYYVLLSVWDDAASYDQIGIANAGGVFGVAYSTTSYCATSYYYSPNAYALTPGVTYNFSMTIFGGTVAFNVADPSGVSVWSLSQGTGGNNFVDSAFYSCDQGYYGNITAYDYTDYEEVYQTSGNVPPYEFYFAANLADYVPVTGFSVFTTPPLPGNINVLINNENATIANTPYGIYLNQNQSVYATESAFGSVTFTIRLGVANVVGSGPVTVSTYYLPTGWSDTTSVTSGSPPFTFTSRVTIPVNTTENSYSVGWAVADSSGDLNQVSVFFDVVPQLTVTVAVGPHGLADVGQTIGISAVVTGGLGGLTYAWAGLPPGCAGSSRVVSCAPTAAGVYYIVVTTTDSGGNSVPSPAYLLHVFDDPAVTVVASASVVDIGTALQFYSTASAGAGAYTYVWAGLPAGCGAVTPSVNCIPRAAETLSTTVTVTDAAGFPVTSAPVSVLVVAGPSVSLAVSTATADVGQPVQLTATPLGGIGALTYSWIGLGSVCTAQGTQATCTFSHPGGYYVGVSAVDSMGAVSPASQVYVLVSPSPLVVLLPARGSLDLGQSVTFFTQATGGSSGFHYLYHQLPPGCVSADTAKLTCSPSLTGTFENITVAATDSNNWTVNSVSQLAVFDWPTASLSISPAQPVAGSSMRFTADATGGAGGNVYAWTNLPGGCQAAPSATIDCTPGGAGTYNVSVQVTDLNGASSNASLEIMVSPSAPLLSGPWVLYLGLGVVAVGAIAVVAWWLRRRANPPEDAPSPADA